ncbi:MAG: glutamate racemase [Cryomorphaceae bacterium]
MTEKSHNDGPIGIFDSGIGGLTVAAAVAKRLPYERIIYFGDTAHLPYGEKSSKALKSYSEGITAFLTEQGCKAIVIACNSASATAATAVRKQVGKAVPVIDVISPTAQYAARSFAGAKIGVIATKATVNSRVYVRRIEKLSPEARVTMLATPLLVAMIEEGFFNNNISKAVIASYLDKASLRDIDALILGCTHFPLIKAEIEAHYSGKTRVIDSTDIVSEKIAEVLVKRSLATLKKSTNPKHWFFVSDLTPSFEESTRIFFGKKVKLERRNLWD